MEIKGICKAAYKSIKQSDHNADSVAKTIVKALPEKLKRAKVTSKDGKKVGMTDNIQITNADIQNINMGLIESSKIDLRLDKYIND